jgi:hypothetical protein
MGWLELVTRDTMVKDLSISSQRAALCIAYHAAGAASKKNRVPGVGVDSILLVTELVFYFPCVSMHPHI